MKNGELPKNLLARERFDDLIFGGVEEGEKAPLERDRVYAWVAFNVLNSCSQGQNYNLHIELLCSSTSFIRFSLIAKHSLGPFHEIRKLINFFV